MINKRMRTILGRVVVAVVLCCYILRLLDSRNELYILHDEFAYWAIAAKYGGYGWNGMMKDSSYYSMGYSLFLVPLFFLGVSASLMYKLAIILNACFVILSYFLSCFIAKRFFDGFSDMEITIVCALISIYPYVTVHTNYAWAETLLYFSFWLESYLVCRFAETIKLKWGFLAVAEGIWMFFIHQRAIGVFMACILAVFFIIFKNREQYKKRITKKMLICWIIASVTILMIAVLFILLKQYNLHHVFVQNDIIQINDFSGQTSKVRSIFSIRGVLNLLWGFIGKYYYFCIATVLLGPFALSLMIKQNFISFRTSKSLEWQWFVKLFWILSFLAMIFITSIFTMNNYMAEEIRTRIDIVFYGRYFEFTMGPFLLFGLHEIKEMKNEIRIYLVTILLSVIVALVTLELVKKVYSINKVDLSAPAFNYFFWLTDDYKKAILHGVLLTVFLFTIVGMLLYFRQKIKYIYWLVFAIIGWLWVKETGTNDDIIKLREKENESYVYNAVEYLENMEDENNLAYVYSDNDANLSQRFAFYIQFNLYQKDILKMECSNLSELTPEKNMIYIVMEDSSLKEEFQKEYRLLYHNDRVYLFRLREEP